MPESYALRKIDLTPHDGITPKGFLLGNGQSAIEIVLCESSKTPTKSALEHLWKERNKGRPAPVLFLVE